MLVDADAFGIVKVRGHVLQAGIDATFCVGVGCGFVVDGMLYTAAHCMDTDAMPATSDVTVESNDMQVHLEVAFAGYSTVFLPLRREFFRTFQDSEPILLDATSQEALGPDLVRTPIALRGLPKGMLLSGSDFREVEEAFLCVFGWKRELSMLYIGRGAPRRDFENARRQHFPQAHPEAAELIYLDLDGVSGAGSFGSPVLARTVDGSWKIIGAHCAVASLQNTTPPKERTERVGFATLIP